MRRPAWRLRSLIARALLSTALLSLGSSFVEAQTRRSPPRRASPARRAPHAGSWEVSGGVIWQAGFNLDDAVARLTRTPSTGSGPYELFSADTMLGGGFGVQGRLAGYLSSRLAIEAGVRLTRPVLTLDLTDDIEGATDVSAEETLTQYVFDGSAVWHFAGMQDGRAVPFVAAGAGYIRDLHEGSELVETGTEYHALAGLKWWFSGRPRRLGVRAEAGISIREGGFDFRDGRRTVPVASASLTYLF